MEDKSSYQKTIDYAIAKGFEYDSHNRNRRFFLSPNKSILNTKYVVFKLNEMYFVAYDTYGSKASMSQTFSGIYSRFPFGKKTDVNVLKRDIIDRVSLSKREKTGISAVDNTFTIKTNNTFPLNRYFDSKCANQFLEISKMISPIELLIKTDYLSFVDDFKNRNVIGIETNNWLSETESIDLLIKKGGKLLEDIISKINV